METETSSLAVGRLVSAAGFGASGPFVGANLADERSLLDVNCRAVLMQSHHFARRLVKRGRGGIILFGSLVGDRGVPSAAHYAASKAYVQSLAEALLLERAPPDVDALASASGPVNTGFAFRARRTIGQADRPETVVRATLAALGRKMTVTPGPLSKLLTWSHMTAPRGLRVRIMAGMTRSPSANAAHAAPRS